jgi:hypothetical protein
MFKNYRRRAIWSSIQRGLGGKNRGRQGKRKAQLHIQPQLQAFCGNIESNRTAFQEVKNRWIGISIEKITKRKKKDRLYSTKKVPFSGYPLDNASPTTLAIHCHHPAF